MKYLSRVVWSEGMHLSPQHFQMQSRYFEDSLWFLNGALRSYPWGLLSFALDADAARNGLAVVRYASGIFPDGLPFEIPDSDPAPAALSLRELFSPVDSEILLYLSVPGRRNSGADTDLGAAPGGDQGGSVGGGNVGGGTAARYSTEERVLRDETISDDEYPVMLGRKNLQLLGPAGRRATDVTMPVARVFRDGNGGFSVDPTFLPPLLRIGAVEDLLRRLKRLADGLESRITTTRRGKKVGGRFEAGTSALDVSSYWFLHALCSALPALRSQLATRSGHPEEMYGILAELAGSLCTFALESNPASIPAYDHLGMNRVMTELEEHINRHLEYVVSSNTVTLNFGQPEQYVYVAAVEDERCLRRSRWVFGIRSDVGESALMRAVPTLTKICSGEGVVKLVQRALQGLELQHLPVPPTALAAQADMQYFAVVQAGPCWQHILATRQVGVYLPGELGQAAFELTVILEANA